MSMRRMAVLYAQVGLLLLAVFAHAASRSKDIQIKVLDSETKQFNDDNNGVPLNCDQLTFDAYCRSTRNPPMISTLLVQAGDGPPFRIRCTIESRNSQCTPFAKGETFDARREKHGLTVYYVDDKGRARKQFYTFVDSGGKAGPPPVVAAAAIQPIPAAKDAGQPQVAPAQHRAAAAQNSPAPAAAAPVAAMAQSSPAPAPGPPPASTQEALTAKVRCNFSSTPPGAEITVDWRYVGSTPSEISLRPGTHIVVISMQGFDEWKRELTVAADSAVNVTANLQKTQP
ncbi:MAG: PEGA domain-containing protein [Terriglobales bacterium]|jgi:hypothetical protein